MIFALVGLVAVLFILAGYAKSIALENPRMVFHGVAGAGFLIGASSLLFFLLGLVV